MHLALAISVLVAFAAPPKAKKPPKPVTAVVVEATSLVVLETIDKPAIDYQAETYSGVPLDDPYAKARGVDKGLVLIVFEKQRKVAFRIPKEKMKKVVRYASPNGPHDHIDVVDTQDGLVVIDTTTSNAGIFTSSDVYVFPKGSTLDQRLSMVTNPRVRLALTTYRA